MKRENHPLPSVEESLAKLAGAKVFTKLDANSGFWQINLAEESKSLTTFITPYGRYLFKRLPFGICSASEFFQKRMSEMLENHPGVLCHMDDILVFAPTQREHDERLQKVLETIERSGITLNEKCVFSKSSVEFLGHVIDGNGCRPDPNKVKAIIMMETPKNVSDVRRFLGMVNQLNKFSPNITEKTQPLRELLRSKNAWAWGPSQSKAFSDVKEELTKPSCPAHYDVNKETTVSADASSYGVGAVLMQKHGDILRPVAFASRSMTETDQRYAQIEKEALAVTWACERFSNYLIGARFKIETDHKPLVPLLGTKDLSELPARVQRFKIRLMRFTFSISHTPGKDLITADALSRAPCSEPSSDDERLQADVSAYVDSIVHNLPATSNRLEQIRSAYTNHTVCSTLQKYCKAGWPEKSGMPKFMTPYWAFRGAITIQNGLLMKGTRLIIPEVLQSEIIAKIHEGHQGIVKCRERAKTSVWWIGLSSQLENAIKSCQECIEMSTNPSEPLIPTEFPSRPWQRLASDLFEIKGQMYLLVVDFYSRYIEIAKLFGTGAASVINHLKSIFARHGIPEIFVSDNGPQYAVESFKSFAKEFGFKHITSSP